jgi:hypothetical protein
MLASRSVGTLQRFLIGNPLPTKAKDQEKLSKIKALAVFSSDPLSSVAYATEEIFLVLILAGTAALSLSLPIAITISFIISVTTKPSRLTQKVQELTT